MLLKEDAFARHVSVSRTGFTETVFGRQALVQRNDDFLAFAIDAVGKEAHRIGQMVDGFQGWSRPMAALIAQHPRVAAPDDLD